MATTFKPADVQIGTGPATSTPIAPYGYAAPVPWSANQTWAALSTCTNAGYLFRTVAGGAGATSGPGPSQANLTDASCTWVAVAPLNSIYGQDSAATLPLGTVITGYSPDLGEAEFQYIKFTGTTAAGDFVKVDLYGAAAVQTAAATDFGPVAVAMASQSSGTYGWVMLRGIHEYANVLSGQVAGVALSLTATAGRAGAKAATSVVDGCVNRATASAANFSVVELRYPFAGTHT